MAITNNAHRTKELNEQFLNKIKNLAANTEKYLDNANNLSRFLHTNADNNKDFLEKFKETIISTLNDQKTIQEINDIKDINISTILKYLSYLAPTSPGKTLNNLASQLKEQPANIEPLQKDTTNNPSLNATCYSQTTIDILKEINEQLNKLTDNDIKIGLIKSISNILKIVEATATKVQTQELTTQELKVLSLELQEFNKFLSNNKISTPTLSDTLSNKVTNVDTIKELQDAVNSLSIPTAPKLASNRP